jgi:hypothetical protein
MRSGGWTWSAVLAAGALSSGCIAIAIGKTSHEEMNRSTVDTRATSHQADVSGQRCYVEQKTRVVSKVHMHREFAAAGLLEALVGTLPAFDDNASQTLRYGGYAMIADGLLAAFWTYIHDGSVSTDEDWAMTSDTGSCAR